MYPHPIHLRGPWQCEPLAHLVMRADGQVEIVDGPLPPSCRVTMPCRWNVGPIGNFCGRVRFSRRFHWPGQLDYYERLWLTFTGADYYATVWLNGEKLGTHEGAFDPFEFDITSLVRPRNDLTVEVDLPALHPEATNQQRMLRGSLSCPEKAGGLWGTVGLEVRRETFLRNVRLWATFSDSKPTLHVAGEGVGEQDRPYELYVLLNNATIVYEKVRTEPAGRPFEVAIELPSVERWWPKGLGSSFVYEVRVELVDAASKLHEIRKPFGFREIAADIEHGKLILNGREIALDAKGDALGLIHPGLSAPVTELTFADEANQEGLMLWVNLPLSGGYAAEEVVRNEAVRQTRAIVTHLQHHPSIIGWTCHRDAQAQDAALDEAVYQAVTGLDPMRLCIRNC